MPSSGPAGRGSRREEVAVPAAAPVASSEDGASLDEPCLVRRLPRAHRGNEVSGGNGHPVQDGTDAILALALALDPDAPTGTFRDRDGDLPW